MSISVGNPPPHSEARRLRPVGKLARPHWKQTAPAAARSRLSATASVGGPRVRARHHQSADPASAPDSFSRRTPRPRPTASAGGLRVRARHPRRHRLHQQTRKASAQLFQVAQRLGGYTQRVRWRAPARSKLRRLRPTAGRHRHFLHQHPPKNLRPTLPSCPEDWRLLTE